MKNSVDLICRRFVFRIFLLANSREKLSSPIVALLGLLGMVIGEQFGNSVITKKANLADAVSICLAGKCWSMPLNAERPPSSHLINSKPAQKPMRGDND